MLLIVYTLAAGILVPLKPGILAIENNKLQAGSDASMVVNTYNTNFKTAEKIDAWIKLDSTTTIKATSVNPISNNKLNIGFILPDIPMNQEQIPATLVLNNELDGLSILPDGVAILKNEIPRGIGLDRSVAIGKLDNKTGFKFPYRNILVETLRNTFFHVAIFLAMFIHLFVAVWYSISYLRKNKFIDDIKAEAHSSIGIVYGLIGLATGSIWAKYTWGAFWTSDVKLNMSAIALLIYVAYWILRGSIQALDTKARVSAMYNIFSFCILIPLVLIIPRLTDSLHPGNGGNPALGGEDLDNTLRMVFYPAIIGYTLLGFWMANLSKRIGIIKHKDYL